MLEKRGDNRGIRRCISGAHIVGNCRSGERNQARSPLNSSAFNCLKMSGEINCRPGRHCSSRIRRERDRDEAAPGPLQTPSGSRAAAARQHQNNGSGTAAAAPARGLDLGADQTRPSGQTAAAVAHRPPPPRDCPRGFVEVPLVLRASIHRFKRRDPARRVTWSDWDWEFGPLSVNVPVAEIPNVLSCANSQGEPVLWEAKLQEGEVAPRHPQAHSSCTAVTGKEKGQAREEAPIRPSFGSTSAGYRGGAGKNMNTLRDCNVKTKGTTSSRKSTLPTATKPTNAAVAPTGRINSSRSNTTSAAPPDDALPPHLHPYASGTHTHVNVCPVCEHYTPTEKDRPANTDPDTETLRARFRCHLCQHAFDIGMVPFDPRGTPGVALYEGEDRFVPPVPSAAKYPCTRCWMSADVAFEGMVVYLKEESSVACQPKCDERRLNVRAGGSSSASRKGKAKWGS